jgi:hypothetical protein
MVSSGIHSLRDPRFLEAYNERRREAHEKVEKNANARKALVAKKIEGVRSCVTNMDVRAHICLLT